MWLTFSLQFVNKNSLLYFSLTFSLKIGEFDVQDECHSSPQVLKCYFYLRPTLLSFNFPANIRKQGS